MVCDVQFVKYQKTRKGAYRIEDTKPQGRYTIPDNGSPSQLLRNKVGKPPKGYNLDYTVVKT